MPNKYEKLTEPHKIISNIFSNIGAGMEAGKNLKRCSVLKQGNTSYSDSSKPVYKLIEELNEISDISRLEREVKQLKNILKGYRFETATLKKSLSKAGELIEELKKENKLFRAQLRKFGQVFDNCGGKEVDAEFNEKEFNDYVNKKKGEQK